MSSGRLLEQANRNRTEDEARSSRPQSTHGPWTVERGTEVYGRGSVPVADCTDTDSTLAERRANARLIACAPELLTSLDELLPFIEGYASSADEDDPVHEMLPRYRKLFDRARGVA